VDTETTGKDFRMSAGSFDTQGPPSQPLQVVMKGEREGRKERLAGRPLQNTRPSSTDLPQLPKMHSYCLPSLCQISNYSGKAILITDYHEFVWHPHHAIPFEHARNSRPSRSWGHHLAMPLSRNARSIGSIGDFEEDAGEVQEVPVH
jgi:hypothetical protein